MGYPFSEFRHVPKVLQMAMNGRMGDMEFSGQFFNSLHWICLHRCSQGIIVQQNRSPFSWLIAEAVVPRPKSLEPPLSLPHIHSTLTIHTIDVSCRCAG